MRVLVVEDNQVNLALLAEIIESLGHECLRATTAEKGIEVARTQMPDLVFMDIKLPGMDGIEATKVLKTDPKTRAVPVVMVTAQAMKDERDRAIEAGADGYITKPYRYDTIRQELERWQRRHQGS
ncbi:MAG: response regulator [Nitrospirae bacterium]|nr:MAG: response regulator [Nitrospirota bacterium]